ncbi:amidohydrolase family protein [Mucilaginibacter boryungensis]|uniref:Amidohydrolase family protein n=1 Tax=Mucilaginibacter boryungensis TaxID=768480 RepID=A0ABR9XJP8_9SPHI|nr:amidohydrolase family protein [Mucilaginibacter boryungensis]MBE9667604.1 amidohydrolase family protein [Mucilaginibacter boryungensis]
MINRRKFVTGAALSAAGMVMPAGLLKVSSKDKHDEPLTSDAVASYDVMKEVMKYRKIDAHIHVNLFDGPPEGNIAFADRLGINKMIISRPITSGEGTPVNFRSYNDLVMQAMKKYPDRFVGQLTLNVLYQKESLEEIKRCVDNGMVGLKVYTQVKISDPLFYPIIEKMIDLKMIVHCHSNCQLGVAGYRMKYDTKIKPNTSIPEDFVAIATRYPEGMFQYAHIGGGGDWEYACKSFKGHPNIYVDTSGSNNPENMIDFALKELGEDRLFFGSDNCYYQSVGKILASNVTEAQKKKIFYGNYNNVLRKSGRNFD